MLVGAGSSNRAVGLTRWGRQAERALPGFGMIRFMVNRGYHTSHIADAARDVTSVTSGWERDRSEPQSPYLLADVRQYVRGYGSVDRQTHQRIAALGLPTNLHRCDVDRVIAEDRSDLPDDPRTVLIGEEDHVLARSDLHVEVPDRSDPFGVPLTDEGSRDGGRSFIGPGAQGYETHVVLRHGRAHLRHPQSPFTGEDRRVDERDRFAHDGGEDALEHGKRENPGVTLCDPSQVCALDRANPAL